MSSSQKERNQYQAYVLMAFQLPNRDSVSWERQSVRGLILALVCWLGMWILAIKCRILLLLLSKSLLNLLLRIFLLFLFSFFCNNHVLCFDWWRYALLWNVTANSVYDGRVTYVSGNTFPDSNGILFSLFQLKSFLLCHYFVVQHHLFWYWLFFNSLFLHSQRVQGHTDRHTLTYPALTHPYNTHFLEQRREKQRRINT